MSARRSMGRSRARIALRIATAMGAAGGVMGVFGAGTAAADPVTLTLRYTCISPSRLVSDQPITVKIDSDIPRSAAVGKPTPKFVIGVVTTAGATITQMARLVGVKTIEGTSDAKVSVAAPQGDIDITVPLDITKTTIPASGSPDVEATGTAPTRIFSQPGNARIIVGDFTLHLVPRDASGNLTVLGKINVPCRLDAGQDNVLTSFTITGTSTATGSTPSGTTGTAASGTPRPTTSGAAGSTTDGTTNSTTSGTLRPTSSGTAGSTVDGTTNSTTSGTAALTDGTKTGTTTTGGLNTGNLILLAVGILVVGAAAFLVGSRLRNQRRAGSG